MPMETNTGPELREALQSLEEKLDALLLGMRVARLGPDSVFQFLYRDNLVKMHLPFADVDVIQRHIVLHYAFYEQKALQIVAKHIAPGSVVLDAGANIGNHTIFFAMICAAREVHSFEVMRETFKLLERNVRLNQLQNVRLNNLGIGARTGRADLAYFGQGNIGGASIQSAGAGGTYEIVTVDGLELPALDFLKIDVEGAHLDVLNGARETLARCRPRIWVELRANRNEREAGERLLTELGYRMVKELSRNDFLFEPG